MANIIREKSLGDPAWYREKAAAPRKIVKVSHKDNFLSYLIRFNKTIGITIFVILSGFLFVFCRTIPSETDLSDEQILSRTDRTESQSHQKTPAEKTDETLTADGVEKYPETVDLSKIINIMNLDYSKEQLQGIFWKEQDFNATVYLSFDDGPNMKMLKSGFGSVIVSDYILDILGERNLSAVFFINGKNLEYGSPGEKEDIRRVILRMINEGHIIGNHSYNHDNLAKGLYADGINDESDIAIEFQLTQKSLNSLLGFVYPLILVRPPYAEPGRTADLDSWLVSEKQYLISLQYDSYDYAYKEDGYWTRDALLERMQTLLSEQENGGVLLLHELESTASMLAELLDDIILERGYAVEGMEKLLEKKYGRKS